MSTCQSHIQSHSLKEADPRVACLSIHLGKPRATFRRNMKGRTRLEWRQKKSHRSDPRHSIKRKSRSVSVSKPTTERAANAVKSGHALRRTQQHIVASGRQFLIRRQSQCPLMRTIRNGGCTADKRHSGHSGGEFESQLRAPKLDHSLPAAVIVGDRCSLGRVTRLL